MTPRLFGTDGVRGKAGVYPLDHPTVRRLGAALVRALPEGHPRLLIGRDTRESGEWIERELAHGARACGADVMSAGVIPTPGVAYLTGSSDFTAGVVISASHNPFEDNGIKVFSGAGEKFTDDLERHVESIVADTSWSVPEGEADAVPGESLVNRYVEHLETIVADAGRLRGTRIGLDCANGATTRVAPRVFRELGFDVTTIGNEPDGRNINLECGSTHPQCLASLVVEQGLAFGVAFDGDGDRAIFVDERGRIVDGDAVLLICGTQLKAEGRLSGNTVVATVMSNIGLELACARRAFHSCAARWGSVREGRDGPPRLHPRWRAIGPRHFSDYLFTGDGLGTALQMVRVMLTTGRTLGDLAAQLTTYPQVLVNVRVRERVDLKSVPAVEAAIRTVENRLAGQGRLLVRYSGTEPLLRIMLEGQHESDDSNMGGRDRCGREDTPRLRG